MAGLILAMVLTAPKPFTCTVDGKEWKALADTAVVTTDKLVGQRLGLSVAADAEGAWPRFELSIAWKSLTAKEATVTAKNAKLGDVLQAFWTPASGTPPYYLEAGTVNVSKDEKSATFVLELTFREGNAFQAAKNADKPSQTVKCTLANVPVLIQS